MCLEIKNAYHSERDKAGLPIPLRADGDMLVWKVLQCDLSDSPRWISPFMGVPYEFGRKATSDFGLAPNGPDNAVVEQGLHAYSFKSAKATDFYFGTFIDSSPRHKAYPAVIPDGSLYYVGVCKDIVADNLVVYECWEALRASHPAVSDALCISSPGGYQEV